MGALNLYFSGPFICFLSLLEMTNESIFSVNINLFKMTNFFLMMNNFYIYLNKCMELFDNPCHTAISHTIPSTSGQKSVGVEGVEGKRSPKSPVLCADGPAADSLWCSGLECKRAAVGARSVSVCGVAG